jgi:CheY-like chemotaxis protein
MVLSSGKQKEKKPEIPRIPVPVTGTPRVLIVEDNPDNMVTIKALLAEHLQVFEAWNGREAVSLALEHLPHLILMDIALPEMNGIEALHAIRKEKKTGHIPVLAVTASAMLGDRDSILAEGFDGYISKPIDHHHFKETIARFIK